VAIAQQQAGTVLVTGGSGYLGSRIIVTLLASGLTVRTTVRSAHREAEVRAMIEREVDAGDRLTFSTADLLMDEGWKRAMRDVDRVIHVASPMPVGEFKGQDILAPAREGTRRVLQAATEAGVRRVVLTSSGSAALPAIGRASPMTEETWTDRPDIPAYHYARAKTMAEQEAWAYVRSRPDAPELTTILPGFIQGPVLGSDFSASVDMIAQMLRGKMPAVPRIGFRIVDVRDLANLHMQAMLSPVAAGERFLAMGEFLWLIDFARILRAHFGERATKAPTRTMPDWLVRIFALFSKDLAAIAPDIGVIHAPDLSKAERLMGWRTRSASLSVIDAAESLFAQGLV
jgi:dihydroflavonol-4-reductase